MGVSAASCFRVLGYVSTASDVRVPAPASSFSIQFRGSVIKVTVLQTGLGWNTSTGALACSNDWWIEKSRMKQPSKELQEAWEQLFGGLVAGGSVVVGLGMDQDTSSEIPNVNLKNAKIPNVNLENVENPNVNLKNAEIPNVNLKNMKQKGRNSGGTKLFQGYMAKQKEKQKRIIKILESDAFGASKDDLYSVSKCMIVINDMVDEALMTDDNPLFYLAMDLFDDAVKREFFINMPNDSEHDQHGYSKKKLKKETWLCTFSYGLNVLMRSSFSVLLQYIHKELCMTASQTGEAWMKEVLNGNPIRCVNAFRMHPNVFSKLCGELESSYGLKSSDKMTAVEKLGIFVYTLTLGVSNRDVSERFQCSGKTISRAFHEILEAITGRSKGFHGLAREMIKPRDPTFQSTPHQIINDKIYMPYFKEGSAHDTRVFLHAIDNRSMNFLKPPEDTYYLVDKGYPDRKGYLVPYPKTRYHKSQFENEPPKNMKDAFNRSHSSLRSSIERSFEILKKRWKILGGMPKYSVETQHDIIIAAFALHNYIHNNDREDKVFTTFEQHPDYMGCNELQDVRGTVTNNDNISSGTSNEMKQIRKHIATSIWNAHRR
nr:putative nuclease HARBI1 [Tanacetum cinerariifolium]